MNKPKSNKNTSGELDIGPSRHKSPVEPTLYSSVIQTEWNLRNITQSRLDLKPIANKVIMRSCTRI